MTGARLAAAIQRAGTRAAARCVERALDRAQAFAQSEVPFARATRDADQLVLAARGLRFRIGGRLGLRWAQVAEEARAGARDRQS